VVVKGEMGGLILGPDRAQQDFPLGIQDDWLLQFLWIRPDHQPGGALLIGARHSDPSVQGNDPSMVGKQEIDIKIGDLRHIDDKLRELD
jgi:hypothetical protein